MRPLQKPGPKSKTRRAKSTPKSKPKPHSDLGDTDTDPSIEENGQSFRSPTRDDNVTDYGLDFTSSPRRSLRTSCVQTTPAVTRRTTVEASSALGAGRAQEETLTAAPTTSTSRKTSRSKKTSRKQKFPQRKELILLGRTDFMIPRACFARVVRQIMMSITSVVDRITAEALSALQVATEKYMENRFEDAYLLTLHSRRVTLTLRDLELINFLLGRYNL